MKSHLEKHIQELNHYLNFQGISWWILDIENEPDRFYCNDNMIKVFNLDKTLTSHSVEGTCPIAGDYLKNVKLKSSKQAAIIAAEYQQLLNREVEEYNNDFPYFNEAKNKTYYFNSKAKVLEQNSMGQVSLILGIIEDITELELQRQKITQQKKMFEALSETDPLTQLHNRRFFMEQFEVYFYKAQRDQVFLSVLMLDIDCFKQYNDAYGHLMGDKCLKKIAECIKNIVKRTTDIIARFGGEEFIILLFDVDAYHTLQLAAAIKNNIELCNIPHRHSPVATHITASIGAYVDVPKDGEAKIEQYIKLADDNLYEAKSLGRNQVVSTLGSYKSEHSQTILTDSHI